MALYRHVADKHEILSEVVDRMLGQLPLPAADESDWRRWASEAVLGLRKLLLSDPGVLGVYLDRPVDGPAALARMDRFLAVLHASGLDDDGPRRAYAALHTYTIGFAALETSRTLARAKRPRMPVPNPQLAGLAGEAQFLAGLDFLLDGIEAAGRVNPAR